MAKVHPNPKPNKPRHFIREWRKHRGMTMEQLAEAAGVTQGSISQLERGQINYTQPTLEAIAKALFCSPADLIMHTPDHAAADDWMARFFRERSLDELKRIEQMLRAAFPEETALKTNHK
ncbi:Helix-turn-helix [Roseibium suaedae]|uniref:Helix-turn-helix n=2 Tax=Roseibium suaedae TaxID=735517 RepID=A0A1M7PN38_9HYPH|nr:Helix-turn-helix [Roseibium suaedae]